jgi:hypothetical protein
VWCCSIKEGVKVAPITWPGQDDTVRVRYYREHIDPVQAVSFKLTNRQDVNQIVPWVAADRLDGRHPDHNVPAQLYNLDAVAYESLMLGFFCIWRGDPRLSCSVGSKLRPKINEVVLGYSRDGFHWHRPDRRAFIGVSEDPESWRWGNVQSTGAGCLVVGDKLYIYFSGRGRNTRNKKLWQTGLAILRRDGFVSMDAGAEQGSLVTRPILFGGKCLFVNANAKAGGLRVELLDPDGNVIPPFTADRCVPVHSDSTLHHVQWKGAEDLSALKSSNQTITCACPPTGGCRRGV